ncbi:MAG: YjbQ family protein [Kiritimatiellaeota bacterium]|nr:YjbQ family protein [Kiritimatiellota bacterium]
MSHILQVHTSAHAQMVNITTRVAALVPPEFNGICVVFCLHTTAGLTINENADPDVVHDLLHGLERLAPWRDPAYRHTEGNSAAHLKATLCGSSAAVPVDNGRLRLGTWQGIFFCEFDGPRSRNILVQFIAEEGIDT